MTRYARDTCVLCLLWDVELDSGTSSSSRQKRSNERERETELCDSTIRENARSLSLRYESSACARIEIERKENVKLPLSHAAIFRWKSR